MAHVGPIISVKSIGSYAFRGCPDGMYYVLNRDVELGECALPTYKKVDINNLPKIQNFDNHDQLEQHSTDSSKCIIS